MRKSTAALTVCFIITACGSPRYDADLIDARRDYLLEKSEAVRFGDENNLTALSVVATYLPADNIKNKARNKSFFFELFAKPQKQTSLFETFVVSTIPPAAASDIVVRCNGKKPVRIVSLSQEEAERKKIPCVTPWGSYRLYTFEHVDAEKLKLDILYRGTTRSLRFTKHAKYLSTHRAFE
jgi:hypothetical protein